MYPGATDPLGEETRAEAARIEAYTLPALELRRQRATAAVRRVPRRAAAAFAVLCLAVLAVVTLRPSDELSVKGLSSARVYWERGGGVRELAPGDTLASGDGVRAEITAAQAGIALQLMVDRSGAELAPNAVEPLALHFAPGEQRALPGFRLVDPAQGERLIVGLCPEGAVTTRLQALRAQLKASGEVICELWEFPLR